MPLMKTHRKGYRIENGKAVEVDEPKPKKKTASKKKVTRKRKTKAKK